MNILIDQPHETADADATNAPVPLSRVAMAEDWTEAPSAAPRPHRDASLLEAFFEGAKLDASALASEDPAELMRRAGAIYQQTILGLAALMEDRARLKSQHALDRTSINAADNNPFKWSPSRKLAQDLLRGGQAGFLNGGDAVRASFADINRHMAGVCAGANAVATLAAAQLEPRAIEAEAKKQGGLLRSHSAVCWDAFQARYETLAGQGGKSAFDRAFADAYDQASEAGERQC
jgi:type VI secretion system FHA domain protein